MKLVALGLGALAGTAFAQTCEETTERRDCKQNPECFWWEYCFTQTNDLAFYERFHGRAYVAPVEFDPDFDSCQIITDDSQCKKNRDVCQWEWRINYCCDIDDPDCPPNLDQCWQHDHDMCRFAHKEGLCSWNPATNTCNTPYDPQARCNTLSDQDCQNVFKEWVELDSFREIGRSTCVLSKAVGTVKNARCSDFDNCGQIERAQWCTNYYSAEPMYCAWDRELDVCYEKLPYVEPATCEGKSRPHCNENKDRCVVDDTGSCVTLISCGQLNAKGKCRAAALTLGCEWHEAIEAFRVSEFLSYCHERICDEGFSGRFCDIPLSEMCPSLAHNAVDYDYSKYSVYNNRPKSDLVVVIDVSGTMGREVSSVKYALNDLTQDGVIGYDRYSEFERGGIMIYSNPRARWLDIGDSDHMLLAINSVKMGLGVQEYGEVGSCPDVAFRALASAVNSAKEFSTVYVVTDSDPADEGIASEVVADALARHIRVNFIVTGTCSHYYKPAPYAGLSQDYIDTAEATGGQIFYLHKSRLMPEEFRHIFRAVKEEAIYAHVARETITASGRSNMHTIAMDNTATSAHITLSGGANMKLRCVSSDGQLIDEGDYDNILDRTVVQTVNIPRQGYTSGKILWTDSITCMASQAGNTDYTVSVKSAFTGCSSNWCDHGDDNGVCSINSACGLFTCECNAGWEGNLCQTAV